MKKITLTAFVAFAAVFSSQAQTPEEIYAAAPKSVQVKMDENTKNGDNQLNGIAAEHVFKITGPVNYTVADLDVHLIEAPDVLDYAINLNTDWSKIRSLEVQCQATFTIEEIKAYLEEVGVTITGDKVTYKVL